MPNSSSDSPIPQIRLIAIAILAALLDPTGMRSKNPRMAIRKAAELLDRLPEYLAFETLSTAQMRALRSERAAVDDRLARLWKMDKDNGSYLTREQLIETSGRKHKSVRGLEAMLKRVGFPFLETPKKSSNIPHFPPLGSITVKAYQRALKLDAEKQKKMRLQ